MSDTWDLSITRLIDAPVDAVWRAWTEHTADWFCPRPWTTEIHAMDLKAGGRSSITLCGPDGERNELEGVYLEVIPHRLIVSTDALRVGWHPQGPFMVRVDEFADEAGQTRYTATARHWTAEARDNHAAMGFEPGWNAATDQLEEVARRITG
ncbi:SRPBCC family protein [Sphingomonas mollis]|uniref:SRPBCC family protein n=1 Tax=Sphingomonas mollis TaxID=2795726 RepID=A0ABS0XSB4_9SPHN|nr:SRPBCC family protein [Sphingomonas sp. BT553]MBJ6122912.1 SRPBCC family protein [Sphingomonas sp. BT553]